MIVVQLSGGLGNQMFQYSLGRCLARKMNCALKLDLSNYEEYRDRQYELFRYNIRASVASTIDLQLCKRYGLVGRLAVPMAEKLAWSIGFRVVRETSTRFDNSVLSLRGNIYLIGYWQCERYFVEIADTIRDELTPKEGVDNHNATMEHRIQSSNSISIHVRRGDYVSGSYARAILGSLPMEYYHSAIKFIASRVENPHFYVFSDDANWTRQNLRLDYPATFVSHDGPGQDVWDMHLMRACRHNIIANSSFSWWAAWLNRNPEKTVIAPRQWFRDANRDSMDVIPTDWIKI